MEQNGALPLENGAEARALKWPAASKCLAHRADANSIDFEV